jgi:hypothetical protein
MAHIEQTLISIPVASSERTTQALDEFQNRLLGENGQSLVEVLGKMASTPDLLTFDPSPDEQPVEQLTDTDLINTLFDGTGDGVWLDLRKYPQINATIDNDVTLNEAMAKVQLFKAGSAENHLAKRRVSALMLVVLGDYLNNRPRLQVVAPKEINSSSLTDGPSNPLNIADEAKIA